ncbi:hypothetical protein LPJ66_004733 [Kickxella alabastrina]|uniref:Uncharacterized protein n=1 Tax=Kickxella alabastrina TaxID=61397 RepID=A0ACC1IIU1_9FUNG|nr:hypothetical protein LPJ66_004733 [Kickxella alabastrina]
MTQPFDIDAYAATRHSQGKPLSDVHSELTHQQKQNQQELHQLISSRYKDFLNLSTQLTGIDTTIAQETQPELQQITQAIHHTHSDLSRRLALIDRKLAYRARIREKRAHLRMLLDIAQLLRRAKGAMQESSEVEALERAAADYAQIRYYVAKASDTPGLAQHAFLEDARRQSAEIAARLMAALGTCLELSARAYAARPSAAEAAPVAHCLRAFAAADAGAEAEALLRAHLVRPPLQQIMGAVRAKGLSMDPAEFRALLRQALVCARHRGPLLLGAVAEHAPGTTYDLALRVFWQETAAEIIRAVPLVFVPGSPDLFHGNYTAAMAFAAAFARLFGLGPDDLADFARKWQLSAYFSLRRRQIIDAVEEQGERPGAGSAAPEPGPAAPESDAPDPAVRAVGALRQCWDARVVLPPLGSRFWHLSLQVLQWAAAALALSAERLGRSGPSALLQLARSVHELTQHARTLPATALETTGAAADGGSASVLGAALAHALQPLDALAESLTARVAADVVARACAPLATHLRRTVSLFRHTGRPPPTAASAYVAQLFGELATVEAAAREACDGGFADELCLRVRRGVCHGVSAAVAAAAADALASVSKTEASLLRLRGSAARNARAAALAADDALVPAGVDLRGSVPGSDNDKIRRQVWLDIAETARLISALGAQPHAEFSSLLRAIAALGT